MLGNNEQIKIQKTTQNAATAAFFIVLNNPTYEKRDFICYLKTSLKTAEF